MKGWMISRYTTRFGIPDTVITDDNYKDVHKMWREECLPKHLGFLEKQIKLGGDIDNKCLHHHHHHHHHHDASIAIIDLLYTYA